MARDDSADGAYGCPEEYWTNGWEAFIAARQAALNALQADAEVRSLEEVWNLPVRPAVPPAG